MITPVIKKIENLSELLQFLPVIKESFKTVAEQLGLNEKNAPTNPAFSTPEDLNKLALKSDCFALYENNKPCGFFALEYKDDLNIFFLERVSVVPDKRHKGYGKSILDFAKNYCKNQNSTKISIGIINENIILKNWYIKNEFIEISVKKFSHLPFNVCFMEFYLK